MRHLCLYCLTIQHPPYHPPAQLLSSILNAYPPALQDQIRKPKFRGQLTKTDSAESQLGLLQAGNEEGRIYTLVDPKTSIIEKIKFLSYGKLSSILVFDAFCAVSKGKPLEAYDKIDLPEIKENLLASIEAKELPFPDQDFQTLNDLLKKLRTDLPDVEVEAPIENQAGGYKRKAKEDMTEQDLAWLPLSAPEKIAHAEALMATVVPERTSYLSDDLELFNIERDLKVIIKFKDTVETQHRPLIIQHLNEAFHEKLHPEMNVSEAQA